MRGIRNRRCDGVSWGAVLVAMLMGSMLTMPARGDNWAGLTNNLVAFWSFDETAGTFADNSTNGYDGTAYNASSPWGNGADGVIGGALDLDGSSDAVSASTNVGAFSVTDTFSVSFWVYLNSLEVGDFYSFLGQRVNSPGGADNEGWSVRNASSNAENYRRLRFQWYSNDGSSSESAMALDTDWSQILQTNKWQHIVVIHGGSADLSSTEFYVDGETKAASVNGSTLESDTVAENEDFVVGVRQTTENGFVDGKMDMVGVWDRALTSDEVTRLYNHGKGRVVPAPAPDLVRGLEAFWPFDETSGSFADYSRNENTATMAAGTPWGNGGNGLIGGALALSDSTPDAVQAPATVGNYGITNAFSVSFWIDSWSDATELRVYAGNALRTASPADDNAGWSIRNAGDSPTSIRLQWESNNGAGSEEARSVTTASGVINSGGGVVWQHVVFTHAGSAANGSDLASTTTIYVDGGVIGATLAGSALLANTVATSEELGIGWRQHDPAGYLSGAMDMLGLWDRELTAAEVALLYNGGAGYVVDNRPTGTVVSIK